MEMTLRGFGFFFLLGCVATLSLIDSKLARVIRLLERIAEGKSSVTPQAK
jgi:hypothetical protein